MLTTFRAITGHNANSAWFIAELNQHLEIKEVNTAKFLRIDVYHCDGGSIKPSQRQYAECLSASPCLYNLDSFDPRNCH